MCCTAPNDNKGSTNEIGSEFFVIIRRFYRDFQNGKKSDFFVFIYDSRGDKNTKTLRRKESRFVLGINKECRGLESPNKLGMRI